MTKAEQKERNKIAVAKYRKTIKGKKAVKDYYKNNREGILEGSKIYRERNKEKESLRHKKWYGKAIGYKPDNWVRPGSYNITLAERHREEWLNESLTVYKLKMRDTDNTVFFKIGLTTNLINRIHKIPYKVEVIKQFKLDKYEAVYFEYNYLQKVNRYKPLKKFRGYTECFI